ncbi:MAG: hypothetical protein H6922_06505 [Pseudomonadaceae bacterium]|nr:hypothetical protein [Pseudomonadaceae bacterium]
MSDHLLWNWKSLDLSFFDGWEAGSALGYQLMESGTPSLVFYTSRKKLGRQYMVGFRTGVKDVSPNISTWAERDEVGDAVVHLTPQGGRHFEVGEFDTKAMLLDVCGRKPVDGR